MTKKRRSTIARRKLNLERLESRQLLTGIVFDSVAGEVKIDGSSGADQVSVSIDAKTADYADDVLVVKMTAGTQQYNRSIALYGLVGPEIGRVVNKISFQGYAGDDVFRNDTTISSFASGGAGSDKLYGGSSVDTLYGGGDTDYLYGGGSNDTLDGGVAGVKNYAENTGNDFLYGGSGDDTLHASDYGNGKLYGEAGNDTLYGWQGSDQLSGGAGHDVLQGYTGNDRLDGGLGNDRYVFTTATSVGEVDTVVESAGGGTDRLDFSDLAATSSVTVNLTSDTELARHTTRRVNTGASGQAANFEIVVGGRGNDDITGNSAWNELYGGDGNDTIRGEGGNDYILGQAGNDNLSGGSENDNIYGGDQNDTLHGDAGNDWMWGGTGDDNMYGGAGEDHLSGGAGDDGLFGGIGLVDYLSGDSGDDRFLRLETEDTIALTESNDAVIRFRNLAATTRNLTGFGSVSFAAGTWTDANVETIDVALSNLHHHVGNTILLKRANGSGVTFLRSGAQLTTLPNGSAIGGWNGSDGIAFTNNGFSTDLDAQTTVYHEMAHNWDEASENAFIPAFQLISKWDQRNDSGDRPSGASGDSWWFNDVDADFARTYGQWNPFEDYATTWETYFPQLYHGTTGGNIAVASKIANLDAFFASIRTA